MPGCGRHFHQCQVGELELSALRRSGQSRTIHCEATHRGDEAAEVFLTFYTDWVLSLLKSNIFKYIYSFETDI